MGYFSPSSTQFIVYWSSLGIPIEGHRSGEGKYICWIFITSVSILYSNLSSRVSQRLWFLCVKQLTILGSQVGWVLLMGPMGLKGFARVNPRKGKDRGVPGRPILGFNADSSTFPKLFLGSTWAVYEKSASLAHRHIAGGRWGIAPGS